MPSEYTLEYVAVKQTGPEIETVVMAVGLAWVVGGYLYLRYPRLFASQ